MKVIVRPAQSDLPRPSGIASISLPSDKSILHRLLIIASLTHTEFTIPIDSIGSLAHDAFATVLALETLGVPIELSEHSIVVQGVGFHGFRAPSHKINCANSGTTARLLIGVLAGQRFASELTGDTSLSTRPMRRLTSLLTEHMGAAIDTSPTGTLPVTIAGAQLQSAEIVLEYPSAQIKSALLLAALHGSGETVLQLRHATRDHTERMLEAFGAPIEVGENLVWITGHAAFSLPDEVRYLLPGDFSSAAPLLVAALIAQVPIRLERVSLNPSRTRFLEVLTLMGAELTITAIETEWLEDRGTIEVQRVALDGLRPFAIAGEDIPLLIDELPALAVLATFVNGTHTIHNASELRLKESDRLQLIAEQLSKFGVTCEIVADGLMIVGDANRTIESAPIEHGGDHRLAMAFAIAALRASSPVEVERADCCAISFPHFFEALQQLIGPDRITIVRSEHAGE